MNVETVNCSSTYRSFETGTNGDNAAPYCVTRSIHARATRVTTTLTPDSENLVQESGSAVNVKMSQVEWPLELSARPSDATRGG
jgi:hypothetical protein